METADVFAYICITVTAAVVLYVAARIIGYGLAKSFKQVNKD